MHYDAKTRKEVTQQKKGDLVEEEEDKLNKLEMEEMCWTKYYWAMSTMSVST